MNEIDQAPPYFYYTLLISTRFHDYDYGADRPGDKELEFNANGIWNLANSAIGAFRQDRIIWRAYVGFAPDYKSLYQIESGNLTSSAGFERFNEDPDRIKLFREIAKKELLQWPADIELISLTLVFSDGYGLPTDLDLKRMTYEASIDIEAIVQDPLSELHVCQGYEMGEYDTGFFSNDHDEIYLLSRNFNEFLRDLQNERVVLSRIVT